jgi:arginine decarboxylase
MPTLVPKKIFLTKGVGRHKERLASFELALRDAGIEAYNLVTVSSIFPPHCKVITRKEGIAELSPGQILFLVLSRIATNEPNRLIAASVGLAIPQDRNNYGYLSEHEDYGETDEKAGDYAEDLAATMLASTLGIPFNPDQSYDEKKQIWKISGKIVKTTHITQSAEGDKNGVWTTVIAAAVLLT